MKENEDKTAEDGSQLFGSDIDPLVIEVLLNSGTALKPSAIYKKIASKVGRGLVMSRVISSIRRVEKAGEIKKSVNGEPRSGYIISGINHLTDEELLTTMQDYADQQTSSLQSRVERLEKALKRIAEGGYDYYECVSIAQAQLTITK